MSVGLLTGIAVPFIYLFILFVISCHVLKNVACCNILYDLMNSNGLSVSSSIDYSLSAHVSPVYLFSVCSCVIYGLLYKLLKETAICLRSEQKASNLNSWSLSRQEPFCLRQHLHCFIIFFYIVANTMSCLFLTRFMEIMGGFQRTECLQCHFQYAPAILTPCQCNWSNRKRKKTATFKTHTVLIMWSFSAVWEQSVRTPQHLYKSVLENRSQDMESVWNTHYASVLIPFCFPDDIEVSKLRTFKGATERRAVG